MRGWNGFRAENYRGEQLPAILGMVAIAPGAIVGLFAGLALVTVQSRSLDAAAWISLGGSLLVFAVGLMDDLIGSGPRGLRAHLRSLGSGHVTTGIVKLVVIAGSSVVVVAAQPVHLGVTRLAGVVLLAGCANLWNGLDVRPGRAIKYFVLVAGAVLVAGVPVRLAPSVPGVLLGAILALPADLRERAMLGDGGSNLLGFTAGLGLYVVLPSPWVWVAAAVAVTLNVLADTVTLSRLIDTVGPLRWFDRLGRVSASGDPS
jgi:UDP-GlcNAc:undecaprenyl-phosphate/decaprenyl-phosphate GlcNAc-1-phosphate transferase